MRTLVAILLLVSPASAAELLMPPPPNYRASKVVPVPPAQQHKPELCLLAGVEPYPGQTLKVDKTCKAGLRWVFQK